MILSRNPLEFVPRAHANNAVSLSTIRRETAMLFNVYSPDAVATLHKCDSPCCEREVIKPFLADNFDSFDFFDNF